MTTLDPTAIEFGLDTFGDLPREADGSLFTHAKAIRATLEEAVLADSIGVDTFTVGEHHRPDYAISSPPTMLAGIATATKRMKLASGVTVLSSDDPVRVFEQFATLDALSNGRAEVILGRGSFTESFPLFGYKLEDYNRLFEEKLNLWAEIVKEEPVTWSGHTRPALENADLYPKTERGLTTWIGVGGSPESVVRTARYGFRLMLAIIGGAPVRFKPYVDLYKQATEQLGTAAHPVGVHSPGFVADTDEEAKEIIFEEYAAAQHRIGVTRGWPPLTRDRFEAEINHGALTVGSPETVAKKIANTVRTLDLGRYDMVYSTVGHIPHSARMRSVELYGTKVIPLVRDMLAES
ncbi:LLM class flavin-dependent oxidoreductase [Corynebacterium sp. MSK044]|uniref:LLM class flavin-dependent oxidoreductase n=1 Tax=Corynebacterium sp. MSK044 TaxID=3050195 RepID=UPI00254B300A|nr:LLM class flavin-dependent oxidoreductase [Corynebacterium sp. MSK044]MDK8797353.1 LLM class flavin-dependent oxidoreductase [Corynebacterium sp. MSK044]